MPRSERFRLRFRGLVTGKCVRARYLAQRHVIAVPYPDTGWGNHWAAEIRDVDGNARYFSRWRVTPYAETMRMFDPPQINPHLEQPPAIDATERF